MSSEASNERMLIFLNSINQIEDYFEYRYRHDSPDVVKIHSNGYN